MNKAELRRVYLEKRRALLPGEVARMSSEIAERFFNEVDLAAVKTLHTFIRMAKFNEFDTSMIYYRIWHERRGIATCAPVTDRESGELEARYFDEAAELAEYDWGIREPAGTEKADPEEIDLVIVPLLCFDESGHRVGYGKGYYDRFLARCRTDCLKIGVSLFPPVAAIVDIHDSDVPLDLCITPGQTFRFTEPDGYLN
ncbi:MAG: 5-formyltetrahydrofolate cyclo-ligase [Acidobacteria bacterium]|nr:5-formyltetrahydrofolate cyclo-ligase [Acidobacteriota bacterium]